MVGPNRVQVQYLHPASSITPRRTTSLASPPALRTPPTGSRVQAPSRPQPVLQRTDAKLFYHDELVA